MISSGNTGNYTEYGRYFGDAGDLVLFAWDSTGTKTSATYLDHTAIVYSVEKDSDSGLVMSMS